MLDQSLKHHINIMRASIGMLDEEVMSGPWLLPVASREVAEVEVESVAYIVCAALGLDWRLRFPVRDSLG